MLHPWVSQAIHPGGYPRLYTQVGIPAIHHGGYPRYTPPSRVHSYTVRYHLRTLADSPQCVQEPWAQGRRFPWVEASFSLQDLKSVKDGVHLCAELLRFSREKERMIG